MISNCLDGNEVDINVGGYAAKTKMDKIKSEIRNKYHQDYFRNVRLSMQQANKANLGQFGRQVRWAVQQQTNDSRQSDSQYCIKLNSQTVLYPHNNSQLNLTSATNISNQLDIINQQTDRNLSKMHIEQLSNICNSLQNSQVQNYKSLNLLISNIIEEIQWRVVTLCCIGSPEAICSYSNSSAAYQEHYRILFVLFVIYKQAQEILAKLQEEWSSYRIKLQIICSQNGVGREMLGKFGLLPMKAIEYGYH